MNIVLIGFRCAGKSCVGKGLARRLKKEFIDCDEFIEGRTQLSIREIFDIAGETHFRTLESDAISEVSKLDGKIVATGGGAVLRYKNISNLKRNGIVIFLDVGPESAWERLRTDPNSTVRRPPLSEKHPYAEIQEQIALRRPYYRSASDIIVQTDGRRVDEVVDEILRHVQQHGFEEIDDGDAQAV